MLAAVAAMAFVAIAPVRAEDPYGSLDVGVQPLASGPGLTMATQLGAAPAAQGTHPDGASPPESSSGLLRQPAPSVVAPPAPAAIDSSTANDPVIKLGAGDAVAIQVYGRPEMNTTTYVADDGSVTVPLVGAVVVAGLSPSQAGNAIADAYARGEFLVNPQVTVNLSQFRSQSISVLGEVRTPGRYPVESRTTVFDVLAQAGGETENGADTIYVLRRSGSEGTERIPIDLHTLSDRGGELSPMLLRGGDSVFVPRADRYYVYGEVQSPNAYRLERGMTVLQAIVRGGGVTLRGSASRVAISRKKPDGSLMTFDASPSDQVRPDDVIRVKERLF